jgi:hypothetical protein
MRMRVGFGLILGQNGDEVLNLKILNSNYEIRIYAKLEINEESFINNPYYRLHRLSNKPYSWGF